nr:hypothetical protein Xcnt_21985 [Xanthomonas campestris pv. centellae]
MSRAGPACSEQFSWLRVRANQDKKRRHVTDAQDDITTFPIQHIDQAGFRIDRTHDTSNRRWDILCP